jgi:hypothetical protein
MGWRSVMGDEPVGTLVIRNVGGMAINDEAQIGGYEVDYLIAAEDRVLRLHATIPLRIDFRVGAIAAEFVLRALAGLACMPQNFLACDREQSFLLPPDVREWLLEDHLAWFVIDAVGVMDTTAFYAAYRSNMPGSLHRAPTPRPRNAAVLEANSRTQSTSSPWARPSKPPRVDRRDDRARVCAANCRPGSEQRAAGVRRRVGAATAFAWIQHSGASESWGDDASPHRASRMSGWSESPPDLDARAGLNRRSVGGGTSQRPGIATPSWAIRARRGARV